LFRLLKSLLLCLGSKLGLTLLPALKVLKSLLARLSTKLGLCLLPALRVLESLLARLGSKLGLGLLTSLLVCKGCLRLLRGILKTGLSHTGCCSTLLLQNVSSKLRSLNTLTGTTKSTCLHRCGVLSISGNITLSADIGQSLLNSLVFKGVLKLRDGVWVKTLRRVVLRATELLSLVTGGPRKLLRRVVWTTRKLTACTLDGCSGLT
jgi:hypothetical protein